MDILGYEFFQNAIIGSLLASIVCGIVGTYIVTRRLVFISGGITHASFGGIGIGVYFGLSPVLSAMAFAVACACGVQYMSEKGGVREDSAIALFWTLGMSIGVICCFMTPGVMPDLPSYLFGNILTISRADLWILFANMIVVVVVFAAFFRYIVAISFDPVFSRSQGLPVRALEYMMIVLIAITIVSALRIVGIVLAMSLLTIPQITANLLTSKYIPIIFLSILFSVIFCLSGLAFSYFLNVPSGASIILVSVVFYGLAKAIKCATMSYISKKAQ